MLARRRSRTETPVCGVGHVGGHLVDEVLQRVAAADAQEPRLFESELM
jgi:hypothetical protein